MSTPYPCLQGAPEPTAPFVWGVAALVRAAQDALSNRFGAVVVRGELSGFSRAGSGHCYFTLKDADGAATLRCAMFRRAAGMLDFSPADGVVVELRGRLGIYEPRGELQMVVEGMRRAGAGALMEQFLRLKARLEAEGLFARERKRELPRFPRRVAIVTSLAAAALRDVCSVMARRAPHVAMVVHPAAVQGSEAPAQIVSALGLIAARRDVEVVIVCRGGGSIEDLWAFNDERVVRAIAACPVPVVTGVGHESDITLADFAADVRAPTPTAAAELVCAAQAQAEQELAVLRMRAARAAQRSMEMHAQRLDRLAMQMMRPAQTVALHGQRLMSLGHRRRVAVMRALHGQQQALSAHMQRLTSGARVQLHRHASLLERLQAHVRTMDPRTVIAAGYALVQTTAGEVVRDPAQLHAGQELELTLAGGRARVLIDDVLP